jgi:hypothetical protein
LCGCAASAAGRGLTVRKTWLSPNRLSDTNPMDEAINSGFRIATIFVLEPSTIFLTVAAFAALSLGRRKMVPHNRA